MYSDESFYADAQQQQQHLQLLHLQQQYNNKDLQRKQKNDDDGNEIPTTIDDIVKRKALEVSLCRSESGFTTWSKLKKDSSTQLHR